MLFFQLHAGEGDLAEVEVAEKAAGGGMGQELGTEPGEAEGVAMPAGAAAAPIALKILDLCINFFCDALCTFPRLSGKQFSFV